MTTNISSALGLIRVKDESGNWKPMKGIWHKNANGEWVPVQKAWTKLENGTWEQVYPTPRGEATSSVATINFSTYHRYTSDTQTFTISNTGDYVLTITGITTNDSSDYVSHVVSPTTFPIVLKPKSSTSVSMYVSGTTPGSSAGAVTFDLDIGYLGTQQLVVPVATTVLEDYSGISVSPAAITLNYYDGYTPPVVTVTISNRGNGGNLLISNYDRGSYVVDGMPTDIGYDWNTHTNLSSSFTVTEDAKPIGTHSGEIVIYSNAPNVPALRIPVISTVAVPHGNTSFTTVGTHQWTVPPGVHNVTFTAIGGGGGGGGSTEVGNGGAGGGGGSGAVNTITKAVTPGQVITIVVGAGGAGAPYVGRTTAAPAGSAGEASSVTGTGVSLLSGGGGGGGGGTTPSYYDDSPTYDYGWGGGDGGQGDSGGGGSGGGDGDGG
jgi:hypothetical protein